MRCPNCGRDNEPGAIQCESCGWRLEDGGFAEQVPTGYAPSGHPLFRNVLQSAKLPAVSGKASVIILILCFALSGVLIPVVLRLPRWIEFEVVVAAWWGVWAVALTWLLYTGHGVADDLRMAPRPAAATTTSADVSSSFPTVIVDGPNQGAAPLETVPGGPPSPSEGIPSSPSLDSSGSEPIDTAGATEQTGADSPTPDVGGLVDAVGAGPRFLPSIELPKIELPKIELSGGGDGDNPLAAILIVVAVVAALALLAVFLYFAFPIIAALTYQLIRGMLARVANNRYNARGHLPKSALYAALWSVVYTLPLGAAVWSVHLLASR